MSKKERHRLLRPSSDEDEADDSGSRSEQMRDVKDGNGDGNNGGSDDDDSSDDDSYESHYPLRSQLVGRRAVPGHSAQFKDATNHTHA